MALYEFRLIDCLLDPTEVSRHHQKVNPRGTHIVCVRCIYYFLYIYTRRVTNSRGITYKNTQ